MMKTDVISLTQYLRENPSATKLDLSGQKLTDKDITDIISVLKEYPRITELNLQNNPDLTNATVKLFAKNETLRTLRIKKDNPNITIEDLSAFLENTTLTALPFQGGGKRAAEIRKHIEDNANKGNPTQASPIKADKVDGEEPQDKTKKLKERSPVIEETAKSETLEDGEESFQLLYAHLIQDMANYTGNIDHLAWYSAIVLNLFMHAATYTPVEGHGKSQEREYKSKSQLQYYRSYGKHPMVKLVAPLTGVPTQSCRLPFNKGFLKLLPDLSADLSKELSKFDNWGHPTEKVDSYVITRIAHAGARKNNFSVLEEALTKNIGDARANPDKLHTILQHGLFKILPCKRKIEQLPPETLAPRIECLLERFKQIVPPEPVSNLAGKLLDYRIKRIQNLQAELKNDLQYLQLNTSQENLTCLLIRLYPKCTNNSGDYKVGVTNVLLSFLAGLINFHAQEKGLKLHAERRQSFGFLRPTLTDAGNLTIRLSLGMETTGFDEIVIQSIKELDKLLGEYNFETQKPAIVKDVFQKATDNKRNSCIRRAVTKDDRTYKTFHQAMAYLQAAKKENTKDYLKNGMKNFLQNYIVADKSLVVDRKLTKKPVIKICDSKIVDLLKNVLVYATRFTAKLNFLNKDEPLLPFVHSYWHSLLKLYNNCAEAQQLLSQLEKLEATDFYTKATLLTENILEYLISLDGLLQIQQQLQGIKNDPVKKFEATEKTGIARNLNIPIENITLYFTDNGQQGITTTLLVMSQMLHGAARDGKTYDRDVFLFEHSYFEVGSFMSDVKSSLEIGRIEAAKIVFSDVSKLNALNLQRCKAMKALVIDMTHHPVFDLPIVEEKISQARKKGMWVVLVKSYLKHGELGLDKYQAGGIAVLAPENETLDKHTIDLFETVSEKAIHPTTASYLQMVNEICCEPVKPPAVAPSLVTPIQARDVVSVQALIAGGPSITTPRKKVTRPHPKTTAPIRSL